jgi:hypothetical protein
MVPFKGYGRLTRSTTLALAAAAVVLGAEAAGLVPPDLTLANAVGCKV